jgi:metal-responsive CopG/Arc/MetJ family transcriptional regulator
MAKIDINRLRYRRPVGRPPVENPMRQIAVRLPDEMLEAIDAVIDDRDGACDRAAIIREAISKGLRQM